MAARAGEVPRASSASRVWKRSAVGQVPSGAWCAAIKDDSSVPDLMAERAQCQSVNPGDDRICRKVSVPIGPLLLKLMQTGQMALDSGAISPTPPQRCAEREATDGEPGRGLGPKHFPVRQHDRRESLLGRSR